ncbi:MAG: hypothetical protein V7641_1999 [Blastocatellia bacterium]
MESPKHFLMNSVSVVVLLSVSALALVIGTSGAKQANSITTQNKTPRFQNKTRAFDVIQTSDLMQAKASNNSVKLLLRNGYDKNITAFALSVNGLITMMDFVYSEGEDYRGIFPGTIYTHDLAFARPDNPNIAAQQNLDINILAVVFDDKSSDGDPNPITAILNARRESKAQLTSMVQLLNNALNSAKTTDNTVLDRLKSQILSLPVNSQFSDEKEDALRWLDRHNNLNPRQRIEHLKETCENLLVRL